MKAKRLVGYTLVALAFLLRVWFLPLVLLGWTVSNAWQALLIGWELAEDRILADQGWRRIAQAKQASEPVDDGKIVKLRKPPINTWPGDEVEEFEDDDYE